MNKVWDKNKDTFTYRGHSISCRLLRNEGIRRNLDPNSFESDFDFLHYMAMTYIMPMSYYRYEGIKKIIGRIPIVKSVGFILGTSLIIVGLSKSLIVLLIGAVICFCSGYFGTNGEKA